MTFTGNSRLSQRPSLLVSGSGSGKISRSRFALEKNFELDLSKVISQVPWRIRTHNRHYKQNELLELLIEARAQDVRKYNVQSNVI